MTSTITPPSRSDMKKIRRLKRKLIKHRAGDNQSGSSKAAARRSGLLVRNTLSKKAKGKSLGRSSSGGGEKVMKEY